MSEKIDREECIRLYEDLSEASIEKDEEWSRAFSPMTTCSSI